MAIITAAFVEWVHKQKFHPLKVQVRYYVEAMGLHPTRNEVQSLINAMYNRLRKCEGRDFPTIQYQPVKRAPRDDGSIKFSESRELQIIREAIEHNGFASVQMTTGLESLHSAAVTGSKSTRVAAEQVVKGITAEFAIRDVKDANREELSRRDREIAADLRGVIEEQRRNNAFQQAMLLSLTGKKSSGNDVV